MITYNDDELRKRNFLRVSSAKDAQEALHIAGHDTIMLFEALCNALNRIDNLEQKQMIDDKKAV